MQKVVGFFVALVFPKICISLSYPETIYARAYRCCHHRLQLHEDQLHELLPECVVAGLYPTNLEERKTVEKNSVQNLVEHYNTALNSE